MATDAPTETTETIKLARQRVGLDKAKADLEQTRANIAKTEADRQAVVNTEKRAAEKHLKEIAVYNLNLEKGELSRQLDQVIVDQRSREERMVLACDWNHNTYAFDAEVDTESVHLCMQQINQWIRQAPKGETLDIEIVFDSPGGDLFSGMHLFDFVNWQRSKGHRFTTVALGNAASMAGILIQCGTTRVIGRESYLLYHGLSESRFMDTSGKAEMQDRLARMTKLEGRMANILSQRAGLTLFARDPSTPLDDRVTASRERLEKEWLKRDWWLDSDEAYALGYVDEIR
jgi:ATP-dependent protease ClpP protease subunit